MGIRREQGLVVPVLRNADGLAPDALDAALCRLVAGSAERRLALADLRAATITLTNYGTIAGRYAVPVIVPPTAAILGAGRRRDTVVAAGGRAAIRSVIPLSLAFDQRCVTGGEAGRFLAAGIADLGHGDWSPRRAGAAHLGSRQRSAPPGPSRAPGRRPCHKEKQHGKDD